MVGSVVMARQLMAMTAARPEPLPKRRPPRPRIGSRWFRPRPVIDFGRRVAISHGLQVRVGATDAVSAGRGHNMYRDHQAAPGPPRMGSSRSTASGLVSFLGDARANGVREALRSLNLEGLAGRPVEEVFAGLADYICPDGGSIDEGIARDAFIETIADLAEAGITDIDGLTSDQIQTVFELYASHTIEARICNDIGTRVVTMPSDARTVERIEAQLSEFIQRGVSDAVNASGIDIGALSQDQVSGFVDDVYEAAFAMLEALGESEAEA